MTQRKHFPAVFILLLLLTTAARSQYRFGSWTSDDGLPQNTVGTILQTLDGYLWMGTYEGLARFDGVNFKIFDNSNTPGFTNNWVKCLAEDRAGNLWIGTGGSGLFRRTGEQITHFSKSDGLPSLNVTALLADDAGNLWIGTDKGLTVLRDGIWTNFTVQNGLPSDSVLSLTSGDAGALWIGTGKGLARLKDGKLSVYRENDGLTNNRIVALAHGQNGGLWIGTNKGLNLWQNERFVDFGAKSQLSDRAIESLAVDRSGALWIGTNKNGLMRLTDEATANLEAVKNLPDERVYAIYQDSEDGMWFGAWNSGLHRLQNNRFRTFWRDEGLQDNFVIALFEDRAGNLWFSTDESLYRITGGIVKIQPLPKDYQSYIYSITEDNDGNIWIGSNAAGGLVWWLKDDKYTALTPADGLPNGGVSAMIGDRAGKVWIGTSDGLAVFQNGRFTIFRTNDGLVSNSIYRLFEARDGSIWVGTTSGLSRFQNGRFMNWTTENGLSSNHILSFYEEANGALWISTNDGGLNRYKNGEFTRITNRSGLYDNLAFKILEANGDLWMCGNKGIYRASLQELNDFADGRIPAINSYSYGAADGMLSRECNGSSQAGWKTGDGTLWFPTVKGLVSVDTQKRNLKPPSVLIEQIRVNGQILPGVSLELPPAQENLEISYTAISWQRPEQVKFKYRLDGLDAGWTDAGTRRTAFYPYLPPGEYTFQVIADNGDGVWNETGKSLVIKVLPPFYRTWWFFALNCLAIGGIVYLIYQRRIKQLEKANHAQEEFSRKLLASQEQERQRIASELHDTLGQSLLIIKNRVALAQTDVDERETVEEQLAELSQSATAAIEECREIAYNLRPYQISRFGLSKTLYGIFMRLNEITPIAATTEIDEIDNLLSPEAEINVYRIVQESVNNIIKHSGASEALLAVKRGDNEITIVIEDDGHGFTPSAASVKTNGKGGFGLMGIAERVKMLSGSYEIDSAPEHGTRIRIKIDLANGKKL